MSLLYFLDPRHIWIDPMGSSKPAIRSGSEWNPSKQSDRLRPGEGGGRLPNWRLFSITKFYVSNRPISDLRSATRSNRFQNENAAWPWEKSSMHDHHPITRRWWRDVTPFGDPRSLEIGRIETVRVPIRGPSDFDPAISGPSRIAARFKNTCLKIRHFFWRHNALWSPFD